MKLDQLDNDSSITNLEEEVEILKQKKLFVQKVCAKNYLIQNQTNYQVSLSCIAETGSHSEV